MSSSLIYLIGEATLKQIRETCSKEHPELVDACVEEVKEKFAQAIDQYCTRHATEVGLSPNNCKQMMLDPPRTKNAQLKKLLDGHGVSASDGSEHRRRVGLIGREISLFSPKKETPPPPEPPKPPAPPEEKKPASNEIHFTQTLAILDDEITGKKIILTPSDEWISVKTAIRKGGIETTCQWFYRLKKNGDQTFTLSWHLGETAPEKEGGSLQFKSEGKTYPGNLVLEASINLETKKVTQLNLKLLG